MTSNHHELGCAILDITSMGFVVMAIFRVFPLDMALMYIWARNLIVKII